MKKMQLVVYPLLAALAGCPHAQTPYAFAAPSDAGTAADTAARTLASSGYPVDNVDRQTGIVNSKWIANGVPMADGSVFVRRFTITVSPAGQQSNLAITMHLQKCPPGGYTVGDMQVTGTCQAIDGIFGGDQTAVDELGGKLRAAFSQTAKSTTP